MTLWLYAMVTVLGLIIGSFLNVCIHRLPRRESVVFPGSRCPHCETSIPFYDNLPLVSFLILRGRCRSCGGGISWQYPLVEFLNGIGYLFLFLKFGPTPKALLYAALFSTLLVISFIDLHHQIIPDRLTLPGMGVGLIASSFVLPTGLINALLGLLLGGGLFYLVAVISRGGMGGGDIKLLAMIGAFLGWMDVLLIILVASFFGSLTGLSLMVFKGKNRKYPVPFGPFLALGALVALFFDRELLGWYLGSR
jgi:leader peptidase (prepilin peptidase)/N-methyltransferase